MLHLVLLALFFCVTNLCLLIGYIIYDQKDKQQRNDANETIIKYIESNHKNDGED